jgi:hypothetical protein
MNVNLVDMSAKFLHECREREIGLWAIVWEVRFQMNDETYPLPQDDRSMPDDVRQAALEVVNKLLVCGVRVAEFKEDGSGLMLWKESAEDSFSRVVEFWNSLGREPTMTDNVFFVVDSTP